MTSQMSLALIVCCGLVACTLAADRAYSNVHRANLASKTIDANFGGATIGDETANPEQASLAVLRDRVNLALKNAQKRLSAQAAGDTAVAGDGTKNAQAKKTSDTAVQAESEGQKVAASGMGDRAMAIQGRQRAQGALVRDASKVVGGTAAQGANNARMANGMVNGQKTAKLSANRQYTANAAAASRDQYNVRTVDTEDASSRGAYALNSKALDAEGGQGLLDARNSKGAAQYNYNVQQQSDSGTGVAKLDQVGGGSGVFERRTTGWTCTAVKDGESVCRDADGKIVGKVMANSKGDATVVDDSGVVVGRGVVKKINDEVYEVVMLDGLATAKTKAIHEYDCYDEIVPGGAQEHKVVIENVQVKVNGEVQADGSESFAWPSCFDIEGDVTIPEGVDPSRLAFEYVGHVMPMGNMKCMDSMTCGRSCYYCNACAKEQLLGDSASLHADGSNALCDLHGGAGKQTVAMRVCPPAELEKTAFCGGFDRHIIGNDYYKYNGSINAQIRVWLRPENEAALRTKFFTQIALPLVKNGFINSYKIENLADGQLYTPSDNELLEWYVRKNGQETLMACRRGVIDYSVGGSDVDSNIMIDAFTNMPGKSVKLFSDAPCEEWLEQQNVEYAAYQKAHTDANPASTGLSGVFSNFLGGRRALA